MDFTCVEIKNVKYVKLINLDRKCEKELDLTTIHRDQELAYLNIYYVDENKKKQLLKSIQVNHIRPGKSGIPELHLIVNFDGSRYYKIILKLNGYIYHSSVVDMKPIRRKKSIIPPWLWAVAAVLVVAGLLYFPIRGLLSDDALKTGSRTDITSGDSSGTIASRERDSESGNATASGNRQAEEQRSAITEDSSMQTSDTSSRDNAAQDMPSPRDDEAVSEPGDESASGVSVTDADNGQTSEIGEVETESAMSASDTSVSDEESGQGETTPLEKPPAQLIDDEAIVYFYPDSAVLTSDAKSVLNEIVEILKKNVSLDVEIIGHCAFFGTEKGRQEISEERAKSVYDYFISSGWLPVETPVIEGKGHLEIVTRDPDRQNLNRRVEIRIKSL